MISTLRNPTGRRRWQLWLLVSVVIAAFMVSTACRSHPDEELSVPVELAGLEGVPQTDDDVAAGETEEEVRLQAAARQEELRLAELELQEREARLREESRRLEERQAMAREQTQIAARQAEMQRRERQLQERFRELEAREAELAEAELSKTTASAEAARPEEVARLAQGGEEPLAVKEWESALVDDDLAAVPPVIEQEPPVESAPRFIETSLEAGTVLEVELSQTISSRTAQVGDTFSSRVARDVFSADGVLAVPAGSEVIGRVTEARALRRVGGQASLGVEMDRLILPSGRSIGIRASMLELGRDKRRDKRKILAAAAAGAILGRILGNDGGSAVAGAAVGAAAGTAVVARRKGANVDLPAGQIIAFRLEEVVTVTTEMTGLAPRATGD